MNNFSFDPWPSFTTEEADAVAQVLLSNRVNYWTGTVTRDFEAAYAKWCGARHAVALANGTLALDLALKGLDIGPGDEVVVTPRTFIASVSCVVNAGATPVFADIDMNSGNISAATIAAVLTSKTKAILCVHLAGWPCDMDGIMALAEQHHLKVIEDCAQAHGAMYKGRHVGTIGHVGAWSFCQDKIMTTGGEGGMVTTNDTDLWKKMWAFKDHGKSWDAVYERQHPPGYRWLHESFGTNWRMLEAQAVIGKIQLTRMTDWHDRRAHNAAVLTKAFQPFTGEAGVLRLPQCAPDTQHAWYKFYAYIRPERLAPGWSRDRIIDEINALGSPCFQGSCSEVYLEKAFDATPWRPSPRLANAKALGEASLMWLVHPTITPANLQRVCEASVAVLARASASLPS